MKFKIGDSVAILQGEYKGKVTTIIGYSNITEREFETDIEIGTVRNNELDLDEIIYLYIDEDMAERI